MKVGLVESAQLDVFQRQRIGRTCRKDNIVATLGCMSKNVRKTFESALAELHHIVTAAACTKVLDDITPEIRFEHKSVVPSRTRQQIIVARTCKRIAAS